MRLGAGSVLGWLLIVLVAVWLLSDREVTERGEGTTWLAYPLDSEGVVPFEVTQPHVKVQVWLEMPRAALPDPRSTQRSEVEWRALGAGVTLASGTRWTSHRTSWAEPETLEDPLVPLVTGPDRARSIADPRMLRFDLPEGTDIVELRAVTLPPDTRLLLVGFQEEARERVARLREVVGADADRSSRQAELLGLESWDEVPLAWRDDLSLMGWRRIASTDKTLRPVLLTSGDAWMGYDDAAALGVSVPQGGATAYNLENEQTVTWSWTGPDGLEPRATRTWLEILGEGVGEVRDLGRVSEVGPLSFSAGVREVRIARDTHDGGEVAILRARSQGTTRDRSWGDPARWLGAGDVQLIAPDFSGLIHWRTSTVEPLRFTIPAEHQVRVLARPRLSPGVLPALGPGQLEGTTPFRLERVGSTAWVDDVVVEQIPTAFERYIQGDDLLSARVSQPGEWFLEASSEPTQLLLTGESLDVQVFLKEPLAPSDVPEPGYPIEVLDEQLGVEYLPYARRTWRSVFPADPDRITREGRAVRIDAQVRWLYRGQGSVSGLPYQVLEFPPPFDLVAEARSGGSRTRLTGTAQTLEIPATGRLLVDYKVPADLVGQRIRVHFQGRVEEPEVVSVAGTFRFERLPAGPLQVRVEAPGVFLASAKGPRPWGIRRVWRLDPGAARKVRVPSGGQGLTVHVARRAGEKRGGVHWSLSGEGVDAVRASTEKREGTLRLDTFEASAEVMSRAEGAWEFVDPLRFWLGSRMQGDGELTLNLVDRNEPVWIWVSATWGPSSDRVDERHWSLPGVGER